MQVDANCCDVLIAIALFVLAAVLYSRNDLRETAIISKQRYIIDQPARGSILM